MIELKQVEKWYGSGKLGFYCENIAIPSGEIVGILGANGSGKTTMLKAIAGLGEIQGGEVLIDGRPVTKQYENVAFITEEGSFLPELTAWEYADFLTGFFPRFDRERYNGLLKFFEIQQHEKIKTFSKGQKSKLEVCAGFSKQANVILMDEPFLGNDLFTRRDFLKLMVSSLRSDETILISTHLIDEIENVIDRAILLHFGTIKADFYIDDLRQEGKNVESMMAEISGCKETQFMM